MCRYTLPVGPIDSEKTVVQDMTDVMVVKKGVYSPMKILPKDSFDNKCVLNVEDIEVDIRKVSQSYCT